MYSIIFSIYLGIEIEVINCSNEFVFINKLPRYYVKVNISRSYVRFFIGKNQETLEFFIVKSFL